MARPDGSYDVYRPYFDHTYVGTDDGTSTGTPRQTLFEEMQALAASRPDIVKPEIVGYSQYRHTPILALKVTKDARSTPDGQRPAVLYNATQHAREWITPESIRRLSHLFVDNYTNPTDTSEADNVNGDDLNGEADALTKGELTRLINANELWFLIVANPDGYDWTFTPGNRLWRKNLRDNDGDGQITSVDGVDPNRNFPSHWGYDNAGSSPDPSSETYRGTGPASEAETKAMDGLVKRVGFEEQVNYHSAAELLLYPLGFQQTTYTADDPIFRALSGTDEDPAIKGQEPGAPDFYDPDVSAELYITNGDTVDHVYSKYDTLAWTPEMDVSDPDREGGESVFEFQDSESDLEDAFEKNVPFVLDVARSAKDPANPSTHLGNDVPDFELKPFDVSYGDPADRRGQRQARARQGDHALAGHRGRRAVRPDQGVQGRRGLRRGRRRLLPPHAWRGQGDQAGRRCEGLVRGRRSALAILHVLRRERHRRAGVDPVRRGLLGQAEHPGPGAARGRRAGVPVLLHRRRCRRTASRTTSTTSMRAAGPRRMRWAS